MKSQFRHIGIAIRPQTANIPETVESLLACLLPQKINIYLAEANVDELKHLALFSKCHVTKKSQFGKKCDLIIVLGGDGTLLSVAREIAPYRIPIIGINRGHLGFLTQVPWEKATEQINSMITGKYTREERIMLEATVIRDNKTIHKSLALNDVVISRGGLGQMIELEVFVNKDFVYRQLSDGLIVSSPTGSTAYSLAAGGPILQPTLRALTLVPICPQSLSNRPIAISDASDIEIIITRGSDARVHFDGQLLFDLTVMDKIRIQRYRNNIMMLHPSDYNYFNTLRQKLHWGEQLV